MKEYKVRIWYFDKETGYNTDETLLLRAESQKAALESGKLISCQKHGGKIPYKGRAEIIR